MRRAKGVLESRWPARAELASTTREGRRYSIIQPGRAAVFRAQRFRLRAGVRPKRTSRPGADSNRYFMRRVTPWEPPYVFALARILPARDFRGLRGTFLERLPNVGASLTCSPLRLAERATSTSLPGRSTSSPFYLLAPLLARLFFRCVHRSFGGSSARRCVSLTATAASHVPSDGSWNMSFVGQRRISRPACC